MTDNVAVLDGFTREIIIEVSDGCIFALVKPDTKFTVFIEHGIQTIKSL